jgi:hypothetical protein
MRAQGKKELEKHRAGGRLTQRAMILAKCFECMGEYANGRFDCGIEDCPLHPLMPYRNTPFGSQGASKEALLEF